MAIFMFCPTNPLSRSQNLFVFCFGMNSPNRDGDLNIDITLDRIRVGTNGVGALDKLSCRLLVDAGDSHGERGGQHKPTRVVAAEANLGDNFDVAIGKWWRASRLSWAGPA